MSKPAVCWWAIRSVSSVLVPNAFPFSERPGTPAVDLPGKVPPSVATQRVAELEGLCERLHGVFCARAEGTEDTVLFESTRRDESERLR